MRGRATTLNRYFRWTAVLAVIGIIMSNSAVTTHAALAAATSSNLQNRSEAGTLSAGPSDVAGPSGGPINREDDPALHVVDHFKCYTSVGESVDDIVFLRDQFAIEDKTYERDIAGAPEVFCNTARKIHGPNSAGISDTDNHLTWYRIKPAIDEKFAPREVVVTNQFVPNGQRLKVERPAFLAVPTHKRAVDGKDTTHEFPDNLDHFKCYAVNSDRMQPDSVRLWDQFGPNPPGDPAKWDAFRVTKPVWLCNPTDKVHVLGFDDAGDPLINTSRMKHPEAHLVCYNLDPVRKASHDLLLRNQFGPEQKVSTKQTDTLCVPSRKGTVPPPPGIDPSVLTAFHELRTHLAGIPNDVLNNGQRRSLLAKLDSAEDRYAKGEICSAYDHMATYLKEAQDLRARFAQPPAPGKTGAVEDLYNRGYGLRSSFFDIFFADPTLAPPTPCFDPSARQTPQVSIQRSDNTGITAAIALGGPVLWTVQRGGETWTQLAAPSVQSEVGPSGLPGVPTWQTLIAVPNGATPVLSMLDPQHLGETVHLNLYPFQDQAADQEPGEEEEPLPPRETFMDPPFVKDARAYATDAFFPPNPCAVKVLGHYRDLQMAQIECAVGQYNPATDELRLYKSLQVDVRFDGGDGTFITNKSQTAFESAPSVYMDAVLNKAVIGRYVKDLDLSVFRCIGEELLVLTHPNFRPAADTLAAWKRNKGIATTVINVGAGTLYPDAAAIDDLIEQRYDDCLVRLSYVLIVGDSEWVPPARTDHDTTAACGGCGDATTGSDWGYSSYPQFFLDIFPDFGVGRIPVDTPTEAQTVADKIVQYESDPPFINLGSGGPFYTTATMASYFQCCRTDVTQAGRDMRTFVQTSETVRNQLLGAGYTVERIYDTNTGYASGPVADATPRRYYDGTALPAALAPASGFPWDGDTQDVINAFNAGRFNILHRDHGGTSGWGDPSFSTGNFGSLTNGELLPVVYSVNCSSGFWDRESDSGSTTESFMERLLMLSGGGMVGGLGDVRDSPTWANSALTRGFYDATWTGLAPEYGGNTVQRRLGDILNHGKVYLLTQVGVAQPAGSVTLDAALGEIVMWHAFGDPTLEMWTGNPHRLVLDPNFKWQVLKDRLIVDYAVEGAVITALERLDDGSVRPLARATVKGGMAEMPFLGREGEVSPNAIVLSASLHNSVSVTLQQPEPQGQPDLVVRHLALESTLLTPGADLAGQLGISVANIGSADAPGTIAPDGSVQTGYMIDLALSADGAMPPGFASLPLPAGQAYAEDGLLQGGRVSRTPDVAASSGVDLSNAPPVSSDVGGVVPTQTSPGDYFLCARIDPGSAVAESNEDNNVTCLAVQVAPSVPPVG